MRLYGLIVSAAPSLTDSRRLPNIARLKLDFVFQSAAPFQESDQSTTSLIFHLFLFLFSGILIPSTLSLVRPCIVHCDHAVHFSADLSLRFDSPMFLAS